MLRNILKHLYKCWRLQKRDRLHHFTYNLLYASSSSVHWNDHHLNVRAQFSPALLLNEPIVMIRGQLLFIPCKSHFNHMPFGARHHVLRHKINIRRGGQSLLIKFSCGQLNFIKVCYSKCAFSGAKSFDCIFNQWFEQSEPTLTTPTRCFDCILDTSKGG